MEMDWPNIVGNIGVTFIIGCYVLLQLGKLDSKSIYYSLCNLIGSSLVLYSLFFYYNLSAVIIQVFWIVFSIVGILRFLQQKLRQSASQ